MPAIEVGRICIKNAGREAGQKCVIVDIIDKSFVLITGPEELTGVKRRRVNIDHIRASEEKIKITKSAPDEEVIKALREERTTEKSEARTREKKIKSKKVIVVPTEKEEE